MLIYQRVYLTKPNGICFLAQHGLVSRFRTFKKIPQLIMVEIDMFINFICVG